ncbi:MAG TPA: phage major capsid protein [Candidatus Deferrimicrobium sp.]|nr:phage major capsid protein [Candidatus Deferrimicrobium sp.]
MNFNQFLESAAQAGLARQVEADSPGGPVDLSRAAAIEVSKELYLEADSRGLTLSELLELEKFDPTPAGSPLDAFERQLALAGVRLGGKSPTTVEQFFQQAPTLLPEFMLREVRKGMEMRPELARLVANTTTVATNKYTPFFINTSDTTKFSLRPVGEGAEIPQLVVTEQTHSVNVTDYGLALKASYKALRYRTTSQFRVLLWYIGFKIQTDKIGLLVNTIISGDGNNNAASVVNTATSGTLTYDDLISLWSQFSPFEMNTIICHVNQMKKILTLNEFKDPLAGFRFQNTGDLFSPLGASLVRSDEVPTDLIIGLDKRFAVEEVVTQPLMVEYDKVIEQRFEEAVISESVAYAKVLKEASVVLDTVWP